MGEAVCNRDTFQTIEERPQVREIVRHVREHRPFEKEFVNEVSHHRHNECSPLLLVVKLLQHSILASMFHPRCAAFVLSFSILGLRHSDQSVLCKGSVLAGAVLISSLRFVFVFCKLRFMSVLKSYRCLNACRFVQI